MAVQLDEELKAETLAYIEHIAPLVESALMSFKSNKMPEQSTIRMMDIESDKLVKVFRRKTQLISHIDWHFFVLPDEGTYRVIDKLIYMHARGKLRDLAFVQLAVSWLNSQSRR